MCKSFKTDCGVDTISGVRSDLEAARTVRIVESEDSTIADVVASQTLNGIRGGTRVESCCGGES